EVAALLRRLNRERGMAILLVSHDLNLASEVCDRLLLLAGGRPVATGAPEVVLGESLLASVFGCEVIGDKTETTRRPVVPLTRRGPRPRSTRSSSSTVRPSRRRSSTP